MIHRRLIRFLSGMLVFLFACSILPMTAFSSELEADSVVKSQTIYHPDGSREEIVLSKSEPINRNSITAHITATHYSSDNEMVWRVKLTGVFTYNGIVSNCTNAYITPTFYKSGWSVYSENTTHDANVAETHTILGKNVLGIILPAGRADLSITCDKDGNLS